MPLQVVNTNANDRQAVVTIQGDTMEEVQSPAARQMAIQEGMRHGLSRAGTSGGEAVYPVDDQGNTPDELILGRGRVAGYRCDFKVTGGL